MHNSTSNMVNIILPNIIYIIYYIQWRRQVGTTSATVGLWIGTDSKFWGIGVGVGRVCQLQIAYLASVGFATDPSDPSSGCL